MTFNCQSSSHCSSVTSSNERWHREADVVDETVDAAELRLHLAYEPLRLAGLPEVGGDVERLADAGRALAAPARDDGRALGGEQPRGLQADAAGRAGDEADAALRPRSTAR